jgi:hypothetical protein
MVNFKKKYPLDNVKDKTCKIKQFTGKMHHKETKEQAICQIEGCKDPAQWVTRLENGESIMLCFSHGEEV